MAALLQTYDLTKDFGDNKGVFGINISVQRGEIVGFVGPNGAGKSTTISMLSGNIYPESGEIQIFDAAVTAANIYNVMPRIGILLSEPTIELQITPKQAFVESEKLLGRSTRWHELSQNLKLDVNKPIGKLSLGNKKKVGIILALMHEPELVFMDEPTSGIDPIIVNKFSTLLREVAERGGAVLLSSHDLSEIQDVCHRVIMIKDGHVLLDKPIDDLLKVANRKFSINTSDYKLRELLAKKYGKDLVETTGGLSLQTQDYQSVIDLLTKNGFYDFLIENPTLEEMFAEYYI